MLPEKSNAKSVLGHDVTAKLIRRLDKIGSDGNHEREAHHDRDGDDHDEFSVRTFPRLEVDVLPLDIGGLFRLFYGDRVLELVS